MKQEVLRWIDILLGSALSLLGFSSCEIIEPRSEYGSPHANYQILGTATDESGTPVKGIKVKPLHGWWHDDLEEEARTWASENGQPFDEAYHGIFYTDAKGKVLISTYADAWEEGEWRIALVDPDGPENGGSFAVDTLYQKDLDIVKTSDGKGWVTGEYTIRFERKLKRVQED